MRLVKHRIILHLALTGIGSLVLVLLLTSGAAAGPVCKRVTGKVTLQPVTGPACLSPVGVCTANSYKGDLSGTAMFNATSSIATADTPTTGVILLTGDQVIQTSGGELFTKDAITLQTTGSGELAELISLTGGTGAWSGASGTLQLVGAYHPETGGSGSYTGTVCRP